MCGIYVSISSGRRIFPSDDLKEKLRCRGPHLHRELTGLATGHFPEEIVYGASSPVKFSMYSSVLALRGYPVASQPIEDLKSGSFLCWNGEAWKISGIPVQGNDTKAVSNILFTRTNQMDPVHDAKEQMTKNSSLDPDQTAALRAYSEEIGKIEGPFAFVYWDNRHKLLLFGRDCLGRRSLVCKVNHAQGFVISSVCGAGKPQDWIEVAANGLYYMNFKNGWPPPAEGLGSIPWVSRARDSTVQSQTLEIVRVLVILCLF
jgi:asparagine synthetase B (glutamine-hydrolysing)